MLDLYLYTLKISNTFCKSLSILNKLTLQNDWQKFVTNSVCVYRQKVKTQQQQKPKIKHKNHCRNRELNPVPLTSKADA